MFLVELPREEQIQRTNQQINKLVTRTQEGNFQGHL